MMYLELATEIKTLITQKINLTMSLDLVQVLVIITPDHLTLLPHLEAQHLAVPHQDRL